MPESSPVHSAAQEPRDPRRVSYADIAHKAGVCKMTVSRVLRAHPRVNPDIAARVTKAAKALGYVPNPKVAQLMTYLRGVKRSKEQGVIAFINTQRRLEKDAYDHYFKRYLDGARGRAHALGFTLEEFHLFDPSISAKRLGSILHHRGIRCVIFSPMSTADNLPDWDWNKLAVVSIGTINRHPEHLTVTHDHFGAMGTARTALLANSWKRIGFLMLSDFEPFHLRSWEAGFWAFSDFKDLPAARPWIYHMPSYIKTGEPEDYPAVMRWIEKHRIDAVIANYPYRLIEHLKSVGLRPGKDIGVCGLDWNAHAADVSGVDQCYEHQAATAIELVAKKLRNFETGITEWPSSIAHSGIWKQGDTA